MIFNFDTFNSMWIADEFLLVGLATAEEGAAFLPSQSVQNCSFRESIPDDHIQNFAWSPVFSLYSNMDAQG